jgi:soluble lytic murein transglycosylase-like protein
MLAQTWANWRSEMEKASALTEVPVEWILGVATVESGLWSGTREKQASIGSTAGAIGVMQIMAFNAPAYGVKPEDLYDPETNIVVGAKILRDIAAKSGDWVTATAPYNSGCGWGSAKKPCCVPGQNALSLRTASVEGISYPELTIRYVNTALLEMGVGEREGRSVLPWIVALAIGGMAFAWVRRA